MDELDLLKNHWKNDNQFPKIKGDDIRRMLHKSSSSIVKWIFVISIIEFIVGGLIMVFMPSSLSDATPFEQGFAMGMEVIFYLVIIYFIYQFFTSFRKIRSTENTKSLLNNIVRTRRHVENYIKFNIYFIYFSVLIVSTFAIHQQYMQVSASGSFALFVVLFILGIAFFCFVFVLLLKFYYKIVYGLLLKKLNNNYEELVQLENESE